MKGGQNMAKLPKVAQYVKNVGKSVAFMSIDAVKQNSDGISDFLEVNDDVFREVYSSVKNYRQTIRDVDRSIKQSNIYQAVDVGFHNLIDDLKTGKFYNDRTSELGEEALGLNDFDFDEGDISFNESGGESSSSSRSSTEILANAFENSSNVQSTVVAESASMIAGTTKASTKLLMSHMDRNNARITAGIGSVYSNISATNEFLKGPMMAHLENSRRFYEETTKTTTEINLMLKELLEMQRNMYKTEAAREKESMLDSSMTYDGGINLKEYARNIKKNAGSILDETGLSMFNMDLGGGNPYLLYAAAPVKLIMQPLIERMLSKDFKKAVASFDKGVTSLFSQFVSKMNNAAKSSDGGVLSWLGKLFGIDISIKDKIDTSNYKKDAVPFDGITRQSIIETIPGYLARIESALTGDSERHYDYNKGTWKSAKQVEREFNRLKDDSLYEGNSGIINDMEASLRKLEMKGAGGRKKAAELRKKYEKMIEKIYNDNGNFSPGGINDMGIMQDAWEYYGFDSKDEFDFLYNSMSRDNIRRLASSNMRARESLTRNIKNLEKNGGPSRNLFNGAYDMSGKGDGKRHNPSEYIPTNILELATDKKRRNVFWYLDNILTELKEYRRTRGKKGGKYQSKQSRQRSEGGSDSSSSSSGDEDPDPDGEATDEEAESMFASFIEEEAKAKEEEAKKKGTKQKLGDKLNEKFGNSAIGRGLAKVLGKAEGLLSKPMEYMTTMLNKADDSLFRLMFGENKRVDEDGNEIEGIFNVIKFEAKKCFKEIGDFFKTQFKNIKEKLAPYFQPFIDKLKEMFAPVRDAMKDIFGKVRDKFKGAFGHVFGGAADKFKDKFGKKTKASEGTDTVTEEATEEDQETLAQRLLGGEVIPTDEVVEETTSSKNKKKKPGRKKKKKNKKKNGGVVESAYGRYVTERGLTMISPGEIIIPASFDANEQNRMLALEKMDRARIINAIGLNASGRDKNGRSFKSTAKNVYNDVKAGVKSAASTVGGKAQKAWNKVRGPKDAQKAVEQEKSLLKKIYEENSGAAPKNIAGGILGGISNGNTIIFRVAVKPVPSIFKKQNTVKKENGDNH